MPDQLACWRYEKKNLLKGLEIKTGVGPVDWTDYSDVTEKMEPAKEQLAVLDDLLSYIDSTGKDALFILSPYGMEKEARMKFNDLTERIEAAGYPVLDFNQHIDEIGLDFSTDFYDYGGHVNALGEGKCTEFLRQYLDSHYELPDRRSVQGYASWDSAWKLYQQKQSEAEASCRKDIEEENWAPEVAD